MSNPSYNKDTRELLAIGLMALESGRLSDSEITALVQDFSKEEFAEAIPSIEGLLDHPNAIVRQNALEALESTFGKTSRIDRIAEMMRHDPDEDVRASAANALGNLSGSGTAPEIRKALASVVKNNQEAEDVRMAAYESILAMDNIPYSDRPNPVSRELSDIDWKRIS